MVETTANPNEGMSKLKDILDSIGSGSGGVKSLLKVDYGEGSKLESSLVELKKFASKQTDYLQKMVKFQDDALRAKRLADVGQAETEKLQPTEKPVKESSVLAAAAGGFLSGALGPILGQLLLTGLSGLTKLVRPGGARPEGKAGSLSEGNNKPNSTSATDRETARDEKIAKTSKLNEEAKLKTAEAERLKIEADGKMARAKAEILNSERTGERLYGAAENSRRAKLMREAEMASREAAAAKEAADAAKAAASTTKTTGVVARTAEATGTATSRLGKILSFAGKTGGYLARGAGPASVALGGLSGYLDPELKQENLSAADRIGEGMLESIPGFIDLPFEAGAWLDKKLFGIDSWEGPKLTEKFRALMLAGRKSNAGFREAMENMPEYREMYYGDTNATINRLISQYVSDNDGGTLSPMAIRSKLALDYQNSLSISPVTSAPTVPGATNQPQVVVVPAPASSPSNVTTNSNNTQNITIQKTQDPAVSLGLQMLGGGSEDIPVFNWGY